MPKGCTNSGSFKKGHIMSEETKKKISEANMLRKSNSGSFKNGHIGFWNKKHRSNETKEKISINGKGRIVSNKTRKKISKAQKGEKGNNWKGGISPRNKRIRLSIEFRLWREAVFTRDNYTCQKTGIKGGYLHPHHIKNFAEYPELRFAIDNGITFSKEAHDEFHKKYGMRHNNEKQLADYLLIDE